MKWYAVHTQARKERLVSGLLHEQGFETLYLHYKTTVKHARRTRRVERAYFPRYVFAGVPDGHSVYQINRTIGVSTVVYCGPDPLEIPEAVIEDLRTRGDEKGLCRLTRSEEQQRRRFLRGEQVRIMDGPMAGLFAVVVLDSGPQVRVWLEMFGGKVEALVAPEGLGSGSPEGGTIRIPGHRSHRFT